MAIHLGRSSPNASRDRPERRRERPARQPRQCRTCLPLLLGLAPGGVFPATAVAGGAVRSYRTISPLPPMQSHEWAHMGSAVCFLWHFPWGRPRRALPGTVPPWSPDFPPLAKAARPGRRAAIRPSGMGSCGIPRPRCQTPARIGRAVYPKNFAASRMPVMTTIMLPSRIVRSRRSNSICASRR
jgi:hypothetical protein